MDRKAETSLALGMALGVMVWGIYQHAMPSLVDHRVGDPDDLNAGKAERVATWTAAGVVIGMSALAEDWTVFAVGAASVVTLSLWHRHANMVNPLTGRATAPSYTDTADDATPDMAYSGTADDMAMA
jgi:hypothetical protein